MAKQASGAALTSSGDNVILATAVASPDPKEGIDFFPLTVEYREFTYAGGRIRAASSSAKDVRVKKEILTSRQIDRPGFVRCFRRCSGMRNAGGIGVRVLGGQGE